MMFQIQYGFDPQTQQFTATIPELNDVSDFGETMEEAEYNVSKAAELYLEEINSQFVGSILQIEPPVWQKSVTTISVLKSMSFPKQKVQATSLNQQQV